ncbi:MAG: hypothetical protein V7706_15830 [Dietzia psychralcaliphila]
MPGVLSGPTSGSTIVTGPPPTTGRDTGGTAAAIAPGAAAIAPGAAASLSGPWCTGSLTARPATFALTTGRPGATGSMPACFTSARPVVAFAAAFPEGAVVPTTAARGPVAPAWYVTVASSWGAIWLF